MKKRRSLLCVLISLVLLLPCFCFAGCSGGAESDEITVALYPYLPDLEYYQELVEEEWEAVHPEITLKFVDWDCYYNHDIDDVDVFMYDSICYSALLEEGYLSPVADEEVEDLDGFIPFMVDCMREDGQLYGIPVLGCSYFMMYYKDDAELAAAQTLEDVYNAVGVKENPNQDPADNTYGLMTNFKYDYPYYYLDAYVDAEGEYDDFSEMPALDNPAALTALNQMVDMLGEKFAFGLFENFGYDNYVYAQRFNEGKGRVFIGYSENMAFMQDIADQIDIKTISMTPGDNVQLYFSDIVSINANVEDDKRDECLELANIISSNEVISNLIVKDGVPQYILPARGELYEELMETYPLYGRLYDLMINQDSNLFRFGDAYYDYIEQADDVIPENMEALRAN